MESNRNTFSHAAVQYSTPLNSFNSDEKDEKKLAKWFNKEIGTINLTTKPSKRYSLLAKLYFSMHETLASNKLSQIENDQLKSWMEKEKLHRKLSALQHNIAVLIIKYDQEKHSGSLEAIIKKLQELIKKLNKHAESIGKTSANFNTIQTVNLLNFLVSEARQPYNQHALINSLISFFIDLQEKILFLAEKNDQLSSKTIYNLFSICHDIFLQVLFLIPGNDKEFLLLKESFYYKSELSTELREYLQRLDLNAFSAMQLQNLEYFPTENPKVTALGGKTNLVFKIEDKQTTVIAKSFLYNPEIYEALYARSLDVRKALGHIGYKVLGKIYYEREILKPLQNGSEKLGRIEIGEYCQKGSLENVISNTLHSDSSTLTTEQKQKLILTYSINCITVIKYLADRKIFFPDIKTTNFLVTESDDILTCDDKTMSVRPDFFVAPADVEHTRDNLPPEVEATVNVLKIGGKCDLLAMMKYQLGLSLYELVTGDLKYKFDKSNNALKFNHEMFQGPIGKKLLKITQSLMNPLPEQRMSLEKALFSLQKLTTPKSISHSTLFSHSTPKQPLRNGGLTLSRVTALTQVNSPIQPRNQPMSRKTPAMSLFKSDDNNSKTTTQTPSNRNDEPNEHTVSLNFYPSPDSPPPIRTQPMPRKKYNGYLFKDDNDKPVSTTTQTPSNRNDEDSKQTASLNLYSLPNSPSQSRTKQLGQRIHTLSSVFQNDNSPSKTTTQQLGSPNHKEEYKKSEKKM